MYPGGPFFLRKTPLFGVCLHRIRPCLIDEMRFGSPATRDGWEHGSVCGKKWSILSGARGGPLTLSPLVVIMAHMAYYVYILRCVDNNHYYGYTSDLARRFREHCQGEVPSTKPRLPAELVYYEVYATASEARKRERGLKNGHTRAKTIQWLIKTFPKEKLLPFA